MATEITCNEITKEFEAVDMVYTDVVSSLTQAFYCTPFDCKGILEVIVDAGESEEDVTLSLSTNSFSDPEQKKIDIEIPAGETKLVGISSGRTAYSDGKLYFSIKADTALTALGVRFAVIKRRFVTNY